MFPPPFPSFLLFLLFLLLLTSSLSCAKWYQLTRSVVQCSIKISTRLKFNCPSANRGDWGLISEARLQPLPATWWGGKMTEEFKCVHPGVGDIFIRMNYRAAYSLTLQHIHVLLTCLVGPGRNKRIKKTQASIVFANARCQHQNSPRIGGSGYRNNIHLVGIEKKTERGKNIN